MPGLSHFRENFRAAFVLYRASLSTHFSEIRSHKGAEIKNKNHANTWFKKIGATGFEPATSRGAEW